MKLAIFGSTGGTGYKLLEQTLQQGHFVTVLVRNSSSLELEHENLKVIKGDVLDQPTVDSVVKDQDAVLCALGAPAFDKSKLRANGTKDIIQAMNTHGIKRLICQSSIGIGDSYDLLPFYYKYLIIPLMLRFVFADHALQESYIKNSQLDWTIVRAAALTNGEHTGNYLSGVAVTTKKIKLKISRADTADFMLKQLSDNSNLCKSPCISY